MSYKKVIVAMSGGVDSSVAALLLKQQGYVVEGLFMKNWQEDETNLSHHCHANQDFIDAKIVSLKLGIRLHSANFSNEYWDNVFEHFLEQYQNGLTPNPDILCNKEIKFKAFLKTALALGANYIATGHYAKTCRQDDTILLLKGKDDNKDQSYFLHTLNQYQLSRVLFPIGTFQKTAIRSLAKQYKLHNHDKKDSTGICFIGEKKFNTFLGQYLNAKPGIIKTTEGSIIGKHQGLIFYTIGQRRGLGIGGRKDGDEMPWYVIDKDLSTNVLIVAQGHNHPTLFKTSTTATRLSWISGTAPKLPLKCQAKIRYRQQQQPCWIVSIKEDIATIRFDEKQRAVTPGQAIVFYQGDICLGGGVIQ